MMFSGAPQLVSFDSGSAGSAVPSASIGSNISEENSMARAQARIVPAKFVPAPSATGRRLMGRQMMDHQIKTSPSAEANNIAVSAVGENGKASRTPAGQTVADTKTKPGNPAVIPAKATRPRVNSPVLIRSSMSKDEVLAPQTLILIMQSGRYDAAGAVVWDLCVWQVTVGPGRRGMAPEIIVKSI
jgi:hypothetical protein